MLLSLGISILITAFQLNPFFAINRALNRICDVKTQNHNNPIDRHRTSICLACNAVGLERCLAVLPRLENAVLATD